MAADDLPPELRQSPLCWVLLNPPRVFVVAKAPVACQSCRAMKAFFIVRPVGPGRLEARCLECDSRDVR